MVEAAMKAHTRSALRKNQCREPGNPVVIPNPAMGRDSQLLQGQAPDLDQARSVAYDAS